MVDICGFGDKDFFMWLMFVDFRRMVYKHLFTV